MLYIVIGGLVEQFSYRFMLHALLIVVRLHAPLGGSVNRTVNGHQLPNRRAWRVGQNTSLFGSDFLPIATKPNLLAIQFIHSANWRSSLMLVPGPAKHDPYISVTILSPTGKLPTPRAMRRHVFSPLPSHIISVHLKCQHTCRNNQLSCTSILRSHSPRPRLGRYIPHSHPITGSPL